MDLDALSHLLIVLAACDWVFTVLIYISARQLHEAALTERATTSVILSSAATGAAALAAVRLGFLDLSAEWRLGILIGILLLVSLPQFIWVLSLAMGRFK